MDVGRPVAWHGCAAWQRRGTLLGAFAVLPWLGGCNSSANKGAPEATASAPAPVTKGLRINGEPVDVEHRLAIGTEGESALRVVLSSGDMSCPKLRAAYPERPEIAKPTLDFVLMQPLEPSGEAGRWAFLSAHITDGWGSRGLAALGGLVADTKSTPDSVSASGLELALQDRRGPRELLYSGDVEAQHCGRVALKAPPRPQPELKVSIGSLVLPIAGASVRPEAGKHHLRLTRAPHGCSSLFTSGYDIVVDLVLEDVEPLKLALISLNGERLPDSPSASVKQQPKRLAIEGEGLSSGRGPITVQIDASVDVHGYKTQVVGSIDALRCIQTSGAPAASAKPTVSAKPTTSAKPAASGAAKP